MKTIVMADPVRFPRMTTKELRESFLHNTLYEPGKINFNYVVDADRAAIGMAAPVDAPIVLPTYPQLRAAYFTERRELGASEHRRQRRCESRRKQLRAEQS
jgi:4-deoxy-L-threo-5-hexosulose-uronate ketol-isomerase